MSDDFLQLKMFVEAAILASEHPITIDHLKQLFDENDRPTTEILRNVLATLTADCSERGIELAEVASGFRYQVKAEFGQKINKLFEERPPRYTRAFLETLALIAYRQPITRGEIEDIRGVAVSTNIIKTLVDREWVRVVGYRDVPGRPGLYATTRQFLDYFNLKSLEQLPSLVELQNLDLLADKLEEKNPELQHMSEDDVHQRNVHVELGALENKIHEDEVELDVNEYSVVENDVHTEHNVQENKRLENNIHEADADHDVYENKEHKQNVRVDDIHEDEEQDVNLTQERTTEEEDDSIEIIEPAHKKNEVNQFETIEDIEIEMIDENVNEINAIEIKEEYTHEIIEENSYEATEKYVLEMTDNAAEELIEMEMAEDNVI